MPLDATTASDRLAATAASIVVLLSDLTTEQARWHPASDAWSALEVINHLVDEEREDFRQRLDLTLHAPGTVPPPIHPGAWVTERDYQGRDLRESVERFTDERQHSLTWLQALSNPDWSLRCADPRLSDMTAGDFLASWVAHDLLHVRQLVEWRWAALGAEIAPYRREYAGEW